MQNGQVEVGHPESPERRNEGRIVRILERRTHQVVGILKKARYHCFVIVDDPGFPNSVRIPDPGQIKENHKVLVAA